MSEGNQRALYYFHPTLILEDRLEAERYFTGILGLFSHNARNCADFSPYRGYRERQ